MGIANKQGDFCKNDAVIAKSFGELAAISLQRSLTSEKLKLQEEQLRRTQKMEAISSLAGGIAHDFNNMLGIILGYADMLLEDMPPRDPNHEVMTEIRQAADRSAILTRQLLTFARKQTVSPEVLNLNTTVSGMLKMLGRLIGEDIDLVWKPGTPLSPVKIDPSQIDQILANLCVNARDAISGTGTITIETMNETLDDAYCNLHPETVPGDYVMLSVSDSGSGMDKAIIDDIFEPFFTTKEDGKGTGLGLATVYGIVKQNDGAIDVSSRPGIGTAFRLYFPVFRGDPASVPEKPEEAAMTGDETILLVEDEASVLSLVKTMLTKLGYRVIPASTPGEAIRLAENHAGDIQLIISDMIMPEMNGRDLSDRLMAFHPGAKCLFVSGYTSDVISKQGRLEPGLHLLKKPFTRKELGAKVRSVLDNAI
jgi:signal transduction histidine kinase/CheY-like chemotaxis protein